MHDWHLSFFILTILWLQTFALNSVQITAEQILQRKILISDFSIYYINIFEKKHTFHFQFTLYVHIVTLYKMFLFAKSHTVSHSLCVNISWTQIYICTKTMVGYVGRRGRRVWESYKCGSDLPHNWFSLTPFPRFGLLQNKNRIKIIWNSYKNPINVNQTYSTISSICFFVEQKS